MLRIKEYSSSSPFDLTELNFVSNATTSSTNPDAFYNPFNCQTADYCFGKKVYINRQLKALMQGMSKYAEEYDDWYEAWEWYGDFLYIEELNENLTDSIAYAIISKTANVSIQPEGSSSFKTYRSGEIQGKIVLSS